MRARTNFLIDAAIMAAYTIATNPMATGTPLHEWLSIGVAIVGFVHLVLHWDWSVNALRRLFTTLGSLSRVNLLVDVALLLAIVATAMSGLLVSRSALAIFGYAVSDSSVWHAVHSESSTVLLAFVGLHVGLHWSWMVSVARDQVLGRPRRKREVPSGRERGVARSLRPAIARTLAACGLVAMVAVAVWFSAPLARGALDWLILPGGAEVVRASASDARPDAPVSMTTAARFGGTEAERVAVRTSHSLLLLIVAGLAGSTIRELVKG